MDDFTPDQEFPPELAALDRQVASALRPARLTAAQAADWYAAIAARAARLEDAGRQPVAASPSREARYSETRHSEARWRRTPWRTARILGVVAGLAAIVWLVGHNGPRRGTATSNVPMREYAAAAAQRVELTLDDGTRILLNSGSTLRVPRDLRRSRVVELHGEARFLVNHHTGTPFIVRAGAADIAVLGTTFFVRRYPEDTATRVVVAEGRISLASTRSSAAPVVLGARMQGTVSDSGRVVTSGDVDPTPSSEWTHGRIVFKKTPIRDALPTLERQYGLVIRLADSALADQRLTVTITDDPSSAVLDAIALTLGARYVRDGNLVTFFTPGRRGAPARKSSVAFPQEITHGK
jgi:ferric-dicitrate binding protein FerR (iron transport regulator)